MGRISWKVTWSCTTRLATRSTRPGSLELPSAGAALRGPSHSVMARIATVGVYVRLAGPVPRLPIAPGRIGGVGLRVDSEEKGTLFTMVVPGQRGHRDGGHRKHSHCQDQLAEHGSSPPLVLSPGFHETVEPATCCAAARQHV